MNLGDIQFQAAKILNEVGRNALTPALDAAGQSPGGTLQVYWTQRAGGTLNPSTNANVGASETLWSGTLVAVVVEEPARSVLRQYTEIVAGDLIVTLQGNPLVELYPGQALGGTLPLSGVAAYEPWFVYDGRQYSRKQISGQLDTLWTEMVGGVKLSQGILLRRST